MIFLRTHGGLGNQLFQVFYAAYISNKGEHDITVFHDNRYQHKFNLSKCFNRLPINIKTINDNLIHKYRLIKILEKIKVNNGFFKLNKTIYLDGYFQSDNNYHSIEKIEYAKSFLKKIFDETDNKINAELVHIRLGDFFLDKNKKILKIKDMLNTVNQNITSHIMTNEEELFLSDEIKTILHEKNAIIKSTSSLEDWEVLIEMSKYKSIISNGSTLALWASIIGDAKLTTFDHNFDNFISKLNL